MDNLTFSLTLSIFCVLFSVFSLIFCVAHYTKTRKPERVTPLTVNEPPPEKVQLPQVALIAPMPVYSVTEQGYLMLSPPKGPTVKELAEYLNNFAPNATLTFCKGDIVVNDGFKTMGFKIPELK